MDTEKRSPVTAIIVGCGHRSLFYGQYALEHPEDMKIVGVADPDPVRRKIAKDRFSLPDSMLFGSSEELCARPRLADAIINGTMDRQHVPTSVPLLDLGYHMLLEKPFACDEDELKIIDEAVKRNRSRVMICHVLRYTPFYHSIKEHIAAGEIGDVISIQTNEYVSYDHIATCYVRGKWGNSDKCGTSMLLAKCCHDLDLMMWMAGDDEPVALSSFGGLKQFTKENAPEGCGTKCLVDCPYVDTCVFSAKSMYLDHPDRWKFYVWSALEGIENPPDEDRVALLKSDASYGKCVYRLDNNVVDRQTVSVRFRSGAVGVHCMIGGSSRAARTIKVVGTRGEIYGGFEDNRYRILKINTAPGKEYDVYDYDLNDAEVSRGHGGGDMEMCRDFVEYVRTGKESLACPSVERSVPAYLAVFEADRVMNSSVSTLEL
ncbi:MAG: Gfo/Idh/MocA family oxidoreductase [Clostridia bacterium]|nr:Gfo/Idh/MocA family oxidoreductase [Clostridia bacterium]